MAERILDQSTWPRAAIFKLFRGYAQPHYAVTTRLDVTHLIARKDQVKPYHACLYAFGAGLHATPAMCQRIRGETVVEHDQVALSVTVPDDTGGFVYADLDWDRDFAAFCQTVTDQTQAALASGNLGANDGGARDDVAYLSCLPWMDFTALDNALPGPQDCIPRISWGKFMPKGDRHDMAVAIQVHHALVDGAHLGTFVQAAQQALETI